MLNSLLGAQTGKATHKDKSSKHSSKDAKSKHSSKHGSQHHDPSSGSSTSQETSFLFVVSEFNAVYEPMMGETGPPIDQWGNLVPASSPEAYNQEIAGTVFRYSRGSVHPAPNYFWIRDQPNISSDGLAHHIPTQGMGHIARITDGMGGQFIDYPLEYKTSSVFACSALLPVVIADGDASMGATYLRRNCRCDAQQSRRPWNLLHFIHQGGLSMANGGSQDYNYVAGAEPEWMPALVPACFANNQASSGSVGLSGDLPVVIGLMAFHSRVGRASDVFSSGYWRNGRWSGPNRTPVGYPAAGGDPRGFLVQVCCDDLENSNSTPNSLYDLEWQSILVRG